MYTKSAVELIAEEQAEMAKQKRDKPVRGDDREIRIAVSYLLLYLKRMLRDRTGDENWLNYVIDRLYPWRDHIWNKQNDIMLLIRAGAMIAAEIDRIHERRDVIGPDVLWLGGDKL